MPDQKTLQPADFGAIYARFASPISVFDCGKKCAPYNERGIPFCCDTRHAVPTVYEAEWEYLQAGTSLWHPWQAEDPQETERLRRETPSGQVLVACLGAEACQRGFRSLTCRAFPFFPYLTRQGDFIGLSYYWDYEDRCWVISNLAAVTPAYRAEFIAVYDELFQRLPEEHENFRRHSAYMRQVYGRRKRAIPLLHRNGRAYKVTPKNGRLRGIPVESLPKYGPYLVASRLPFPDEASL